MRRRRLLPALVPALATATATAVLALAPAAWAAPRVPADKPQVLSRWTQTSAASYQEWAGAREHRAAWAAYGFDWSTDHCTSSPDNPLGFPFADACARHDFGYRNHRAAGLFPAAKTRLDLAFHADLKRVCAQYSGSRRSSCEGTAWTYYQAVRLLGIS
ncbi:MULTISPECIES: phospholipase [Streptomyces]|uniref:Phospholipase n=1 Tax=Streptomyces virginiae TaxID=1961 RepID=A0ABZ1TIE2_STRVG|nr:phospholipase [Streptomyces virginiae]